MPSLVFDDFPSPTVLPAADSTGGASDRHDLTKLRVNSGTSWSSANPSASSRHRLAYLPPQQLIQRYSSGLSVPQLVLVFLIFCNKYLLQKGVNRIKVIRAWARSGKLWIQNPENLTAFLIHELTSC